MKSFIYVILFVFLLPSCKGQMKRYQDANFKFSVKQVDEFIKRFNGEVEDETLKGFNIHPSRTQIVSSLFEDQYYSSNQEIIDEFIGFVVDSLPASYISYYSNSWFAELDIKFQYEGKTTSGKLRMRPQINSNYSSKWVIFQVVADEIVPEFNLNRDSIFLSPVSHETNFINLRPIFEKTLDPTFILPDNFRYDVTSIFLKELSEGKIIDIRFVDTKYHFYQVNGWYFRVAQFLREKSNSGWLIEELIKL